MTSANTSSKCRVCICALSATVCSYDLREFPELAHKFVTLTDLALYETDSEKQLPSELCQECFEQLEESYAFRSKCIAADEQWRLELSIVAAEEVEKELDTVETVHQMLNEVTELELNQVEGAAEEAIVAVDINETQNSPSNTDSCNAFQHIGLAPYPCTEEGCERAFNRFHDLTEHLKEHLVISRFSCEQEGCDKVYRHKPTLTMHMRRCHKLGPELKSHICEFCGKVFNSSTVLNDHRYTHKDQSELPHACQEANCSRRFSTKEKLKVHLMRHAGIKNFSCPYCGLRKTTRNELKIHMNYHTLERTWHCRFCSKVCNSSGNLKMHVRTVHERARDYACSYCERSFAKSDTRKYHEMTHTGEKPFECEECGKRFTQPAALRTHRKVHERQRKDSNTITYTLLLSEPGDTNAASVEQNDEY